MMARFLSITLLALKLAAATASKPTGPFTYVEYATNVAQAIEEQKPKWAAPLIVGGTEVAPYSRPYVAGMRISAASRSFCGGSLIASRWILTAAHCGTEIEFVSVGTHFLSGTMDGQQVRVKRHIRHPKYISASSSGYDFMLLELEEPVTKVAPVSLASEDGSDDNELGLAMAMGWGTTQFGGTQSDVLLGVDVHIVDQEECNKAYGRINKSMICAGGLGGEDSCQGDSGGPLIVSKGKVGDVLVGVVSWGRECGLVGYPGVYARVSAGVDFIKEHVPEARWSKSSK